MRFDAHVHLWGPADDAAHPHTAPMLGAGGRPLPAGDPSLLLSAMDASGVAGACVVQPACYGADHTFCAAAIAASGGRLVGCALADPAGGPAAAAGRAAALLDAPGRPWRCLRFNPYLWPVGPEALADATGHALMEVAAARGVPVAVMAFNGLADLPVGALAAAHPGVPLILDHLGFVAPGASADAAALAALARRYPNTYVKASALFRMDVAGEGPPFPAVVSGPGAAALAAFGPDRVLAGTDWPWVTDVCSYERAWAALDGLFGGDSDAAAVRAAVEGGNAARLFGWEAPA